MNSKIHMRLASPVLDAFSMAANMRGNLNQFHCFLNLDLDGLRKSIPHSVCVWHSTDPPHEPDFTKSAYFAFLRRELCYELFTAS